MPSISPRRAAAQLYVETVAAARAPSLYRDLLVPDTIEGRYELIVLHVALLLRRMRDSGTDHRKISQALVDTMASDLDRSMRELGVGDLSVGRFMKRLGEGLYGRAAAYDAALDQGDTPALTAALLRNLYAGIEPEDRVLTMMTQYVERQCAYLQAQPADRLTSGRINFLDPNEPEI